MHFEAALNVAWLALGLVALSSAIRFAFRARGGEQRPAAWLHIVGAALIIAALFPYISATDDILRIEDFNSHQTQHHSSKQNGNDNLMRLYETLDTPLVCRVCGVALTFFFISLVFTPTLQVIERIAPQRAGRSPPATSLL